MDKADKAYIRNNLARCLQATAATMREFRKEGRRNWNSGWLMGCLKGEAGMLTSFRIFSGDFHYVTKREPSIDPDALAAEAT